MTSKIIEGKKFMYFTRRHDLIVARRLADQMKAQGKEVYVDRVNNKNIDIYVRVGD